MRRHWSPCRVCGEDHTNPRSSGICPSCGEKESAARMRAEQTERQAYEVSPFGQFMSLPEDERWRLIFDHLEAVGDAS